MRALTLLLALYGLIAAAPPVQGQTSGATDELRLGPDLFEGVQSAGFHEITFNALSLSSGIYIYKISAGDLSSSAENGFTQIRKMLLMK